MPDDSSAMNVGAGDFVERGDDELERLFNLSVQMLCIAGTDGYFKRVNPAFEATLVVAKCIDWPERKRGVGRPFSTKKITTVNQPSNTCSSSTIVTLSAGTDNG